MNTILYNNHNDDNWFLSKVLKILSIGLVSKDTVNCSNNCAESCKSSHIPFSMCKKHRTDFKLPQATKTTPKQRKPSNMWLKHFKNK